VFFVGVSVSEEIEMAATQFDHICTVC